ncbi:acyl-CoA synthetase [Actinophytocola oryzae]|nr:acyl-CoA synthetase [Actinophytocola oryzae]
MAYWATVPEKYNIAVDVSGQNPDGVAMIYRRLGGADQHVSWDWLSHRTGQFGSYLRQRGVGPGDRVVVVLPASPDTAAAILGTLWIGAVLVPTSPLWSAEALGHRVRDCDPTVVLTTPDRAGDLGGSLPVPVTALTGDLLDGVSSACEPEPTAADDPAAIYYTSGTSGPAKGIVHAHRWLLGHNEFGLCHELRRGEVFHGAGEWAWSLAKLLGPWRHRAIPFVFPQTGAFDPVALFGALASAGVENVLLNPTVVRRLRTAMPDAGARLGLTLRRAYSSSEPLPPDLADWFAGQFGVPLYDYYGLTESYPMIGVLPGTTPPRGSMGRPLPGWEVALLGEDGEQVGPDTPGEICLRAGSNPQFPLGYWNRPHDTAAAFHGTWFHTGDTAVRDQEGYLYFLGRNDDVIISSGYRIGPYDLEAVLDAHPAVAESAVVGDPDPDRGQIVHAYVVLVPGQESSPELTRDLQEHVRTRHSRFTYPRRIDYVTALPRSTTNKIRRGALRSATTTRRSLP